MSEKVNIGFNRVQRFLLTMAAFVVVVAGMRASQDILIPFLLSLFIAIITMPLLNWLRSKGIPTWAAILIIILTILVAGFLIAVLVGSSLTDFSNSLPSYQRGLQSKLNDALAFFEEKGFNIVDQTFMEFIDPGAAMRLTSKILTGMGNLLGDTFLILLVVVFMLLEAATFSQKIEKAIPTESPEMDRLNGFLENINRYMVIKTWTSLGTGTIVTIWLSIWRVDYALLWGLLTFLFNYIPNIGSIMAAVPPFLLALVTLGPWTALAVALGYLAVNMTIGSFLEPRLMGRGLGLSTLVVFLSLLFWGWVLGPVGMILSVPLTMTMKIALSSFDETQWLSALLDGGSSVKTS
ncbi:MAG: AI-2E family transporter [Candidatus Marinimicrobia bacterium]|jgi:predicted PurR-regulated permease PerM|nr:AI-2E family transporter [Candidatus Neomarinimicrobiota bacterium]MBT3679460.1 AI-2E family transporter [Candidatus Neomarinimicrobiota bacterium]MBT3951071.1 AI-2E family transporter [Candidatus Neomarinimicrobiota bacterium]MBT4254249.1 AI-2E family transporter [Candidatus Neomarinimicrobiota bacterium]MBT4479430.1 AI-2E family transporter [Candidatus Neomarinimicrobiota bacterium]